MATFSGKNARVSLGDGASEHIILEIGTWKINAKAGEIDTTSFGDGWGKSDSGMKTWSGSLSGNFDPTDTDGQVALDAAYRSGELVQDMKFYLKYQATGQVIYFTPDLTADPGAGLRITQLDVDMDKANVGKISMSFSGSGPYVRVIETRQ